MSWWLWVLMGFLLLAGEILTPGGFFIIFFGFGALLVGIFKLLPIGAPEWVDWLLFSILSLLSLAFFRKPLIERMRTRASGPPVDSLAGETVTARAEIPAGETGQVEFRGTTWKARNLSETPISPGQKCVVERVDGLTLCLRPR